MNASENFKINFSLSWFNGADSCHGTITIVVWNAVNAETASQRATDQLRVWFKASIDSVVCIDIGEGK